MDATLALTHAADFAQTLMRDNSPRLLILIAQVSSDDGPVNVGVSWPPGVEADAAIVMRETADVFARQAEES